MTNPSDPMDPTPTPAAPLHKTRPFYWSVRRELWENRSLYLAPLAVAALALCGLLFSTIGMAGRRLQTLQLPPAKQTALIAQPYEFAHGAVMVTGFVVAVVYCLGALHGERRDRSVLFWKSLPVSDLTTVLAKSFMPTVVLPVITAAIVIALQLAMYAWSAIVLATHGVAQPTLAQLPIGELLLVTLYSVVVFTLWYAPLYAWCIMVSGWSRRVPFLWAVLPPAALCLAEKLAFNTTYLTQLVIARFRGVYTYGFVAKPPHLPNTPAPTPPVGLAQIDPSHFVTAPGLWIGLVVAAAFIAVSVWLRRRREPL
jgi:ABC-2 type transport system permease protein